MRFVLFICLLSFSFSISSQVLTLDECLKLSKDKYPLQTEFNNLEQQTQLRLRNLSARFYPTMDLTGQFSWQNDVTHFNSPSPTFQAPKAAQDQYKAYVDVKQLIYDGGMTKAAKSVEKSQQALQNQSLEVELYGIREQVIQAYYLILNIDEQIKVVDYRMDILQKRLADIQSGVENGMVLQSEADAFKVEILKLEQERYGLEEGQRSAREILEELTGLSLAEEMTLSLPLISESAAELNRPEKALFNAQRLQLDANKKLVTQQRMPVIAGFGQLGYGNPGYNMLKDEFDTFYMVGVRLNWKIWDWKETSRKKELLQMQVQTVDAREATFDKNIRMASDNMQARIRQMERMMEKDEEIIALRKRITQAAHSRLNNGTYTASDYITEFNAESMAILAKQLHAIELNKARRELHNLLGY